MRLRSQWAVPILAFGVTLGLVATFSPVLRAQNAPAQQQKFTIAVGCRLTLIASSALESPAAKGVSAAGCDSKTGLKNFAERGVLQMNGETMDLTQMTEDARPLQAGETKCKLVNKTLITEFQLHSVSPDAAADLHSDRFAFSPSSLNGSGKFKDLDLATIVNEDFLPTVEDEYGYSWSLNHQATDYYAGNLTPGGFGAVCAGAFAKFNTKSDLIATTLDDIIHTDGSHTSGSEKFKGRCDKP
jgi:hypothetical protein